MADDADFSTDSTPTLQQLATFFADELFSVDRIKRLENLHRNAYAEGATIATAAQVQAAPALGERKKQLLDDDTGFVQKMVAEAAALVVAHMLGVELPAFSKSGSGGTISNSSVGKAISSVLLAGIAGDGADVVPGDDGAKRLMSMIGHLTMTGWFEGIIFEEMASLGGFVHAPEAIAQLGHDLVDAMGLSRMMRRALTPYVNVLMTTPLQWKLHKQYRPTLLAEASIIQAFIAGDYTQAEAAEELSRLGYSDRRQDILLKHATKWLSAADALVLIRDGQYDRDFAVQNLRAQGYDQVGAEQALRVEELKHLAAIRDDSVAAIKAAYVDRRIDDSQLATYLSAIYASDEEQSAHVTAIRTIRDLNTKRLTAAETKDAVIAGVLAIVDYRAALVREGYEPDDALALELLLETKLNAAADVDKLRKQKQDDAAAAKAAADAAAKAKAADVEQKRQLAAKGSLTMLQRAVVRGLIPTSRYTEVLTPQYDADTVQTMIALVEQDRAAYVAQQAKADDAAKRATLRHVDTGALQTAYLEGVITLDQVRAQLTALNFDAPDVDILVSTMQAKQADQAAAKQQRADAAAKAKTKSIDLGRFEALVRAGHRTMADYSSLLSNLGYDAGSVAAMVDLLNLKITDDQKARDARAAAAAQSQDRGLSLEQIRRAVILGNATIDQFVTFLVQNKYTVDAQGVLVAELRDAVDSADAARAKREAAAGVTVETHAPLSTVERAARLGVVSPDVYEARLRAANYTDDDVAIEMDLLAVEIADVQAQRAKAAAAAAKLPEAELTLAQLATAVKVGVSTLDDYRSRAVALGYSSDDVATLAAVLSDELQTTQAAQARHDAIGTQLKARNLSLAELDDAVKNGQLTIDAYTARLVALGFGQDDADLLTTLLQLKLPTTAPGA